MSKIWFSWMTCQSIQTLASDQPFAQQVKRDAGGYCEYFVARAVRKKKEKKSSWEGESGSCPTRNVGVNMLRPCCCSAWGLPCLNLGGGGPPGSIHRIIDVKNSIACKGLKFCPSSGGRWHHGIGPYFCLKTGTSKSRRLTLSVNYEKSASRSHGKLWSEWLYPSRIYQLIESSPLTAVPLI